VTVRLHPQPEAIAAAVVCFPGVREAVETVIEAMQSGVPLARAEMLDSLTIRAINVHSRTTLTEAPTLFLEFSGSEAQVQEQSGVLRELAEAHGGGDLSGPRAPRSAAACGRRGTTPTSPACSCGPAAAR
jgi:D-lactate dehydrogenase (cytochrome)